MYRQRSRVNFACGVYNGAERLRREDFLKRSGTAQNSPKFYQYAGSTPVANARYTFVCIVTKSSRRFPRVGDPPPSIPVIPLMACDKKHKTQYFRAQQPETHREIRTLVEQYSGLYSSLSSLTPLFLYCLSFARRCEVTFAIFPSHQRGARRCKNRSRESETERALYYTYEE